MARRKIMFVFHQVGYGGAAKMLSFLANSLVRSDREILVCLYKSSSEINYRFHPDIKILSRSTSGRRSFFRLSKVLDFLYVLQCAIRYRPDLLFGLMGVNAFYSYWVSRLIGSRSLGSERGNPFSEKGIFGALKRHAIRNSDFGLYQTEQAKYMVEPSHAQVNIVLPNPVNSGSNTSKPFELRRGDIAFMGRFEVRQKRQDVALKAFKGILDRYPNVKMDLYGDGEDLPKMISLAKKIGVYGSVNFKGFHKDAHYYLSEYKYFMFTSDYEGMPNSLIEAMSAGCACVATDCDPGGAQYLKSITEGLILVRKGDVEGIENAFFELIENDNYSLELSERGSELNKLLSYDKISADFSQFLDTCL